MKELKNPEVLDEATLEYQRTNENDRNGQPCGVLVSLSDVRAADDLFIRYDFERDGWTIWQQRLIERDGYSESTDIWVEVAFVEAWQFEESPNNPDRKE